MVNGNDDDTEVPEGDDEGVGGSDDTFDPENPGEPGVNDHTPTHYYTLTLLSDPEEACRLWIDGEEITIKEVAEKSQITVKTQGMASFAFEGWYNGDGQQMSKETTYKFTMPKGNLGLTARYKFDPSSPDEPGNEGQEDIANPEVGDVNMNGRIDMADAVLLVKLLEEKGDASYPENIRYISDVNKDAKITTADAEAIVKIYLRK